MILKKKKCKHKAANGIEFCKNHGRVFSGTLTCEMDLAGFMPINYCKRICNGIFDLHANRSNLSPVEALDPEPE
jgi:hypothetical protein